MAVRRRNRVGGGTRTNLNGLAFEARTHLDDAIREHPEYSLNGNNVLKGEVPVASYHEKHGLYTDLLSPKGVDYKKVISKKLLPDGALLVGDTVYIIEKKYQEGPGSVDEKLQTCDFKKKQYKKLFNPIGITVEYYYVLNAWFDQDAYRDVFEYINSVGCKYYIEVLPLEDLGL